MEAQQIQNAIEIAFNHTSDQNLKSQALEFLAQIRPKPDAWRACLSLVTQNPRPPDIVAHVALDIINSALLSRQIDDESLLSLRDTLMVYIRNICGTDGGGNRSVEHGNADLKITQTFTYLFLSLYADHWLSFFHDIAVSTGSTAIDNRRGARLYLRILSDIHDEIADVLVSRDPQEQRRSTDLKDLVRDRDAKAIAVSWQEILSTWKLVDSSISIQCLAVIKRWVSWTDISLIVNDSLLNLLFELVAPPQNDIMYDSLHVTIETFTEIVSKKMNADGKVELITLLRLKDVVSQLIECPLLREQRFTPYYEVDLAEVVAKLVDCTVSDIIRILDSAQDGTPLSVHGMVHLNDFLPFVLRFFSDEYDEVCSSVIPCMTDLLALFRKKARVGSAVYVQNAGMPPAILNAIIAKMKYDITSSWGNESTETDEAEFQELRKRLQNLQQAIAAIDENLYISAIVNIVLVTFDKYRSQGGRLDWREIDLAMHEMFLFGELSLKHGGLYAKAKPVSPAAERLIEMMSKLIESDIASFSHPAIQLQYMEICVRYYTFFESNPHYIGPVLEKFVQFVHHDHVKVQSRSWYLFYRFVRQVRQHVGNIAQTVIQALGDLLVIKAELPKPASDDHDLSSDENEPQSNAKFTSQLYLYEAVGCVCSANAVPVESQVLYVKLVISPLFSDLQANLEPAEAGDERAVLQIHHLIMALGTLAKGFSDWAPGHVVASTSPPAKEVSQEFSQAAEAILVALETLGASYDVRTAARFSFSRLVSVLGNCILPQLPRWINGLLTQTPTKEELAMFLRLLDQVIFGFKLEIFEVLNSLLTPFLQRVFAGMSEPATGTDDEIQLAELKREYLNFLLIIINNNLEPVLVSEVNQPMFDAVISTVEHFAKDIKDFPTAKLAFSVLTRMTWAWGGQGLPLSSPPPPGADITTNTTPHPALPGFDRFMMTRFSPLCWAIPSNPGFHPKDAQAKQTLGEAAGLQKAIYVKTGQEYLTWLRDVELRGMGMEGPIIEDYLQALCNLDGKAFRHFFQALVQRSTSG